MVQIVLACCATAQLVATSVMAVYARHRVQYLALAWVNGIFAFILLGEAFFASFIASMPPGILHPVILLAFLGGVFLQSIYPLSIPMPGFLQWRRMWQYASPIFLLVALYLLTLPFSHGIVVIETWHELLDRLLSVDVMCRLLAVGLSLMYIINIFLLPRKMSRTANVPHYLLGYCTALGLSVEERIEATGAACVLGVASGADIVRVHDVKPVTRMCRMADAILRARPLNEN